MTAELIIKLNNLINNLNSRQQLIAKSFLFNKKFRIYEEIIRNSNEIFIEDLENKYSCNFILFVKNKCNCG
jgi:hypothetical protein